MGIICALLVGVLGLVYLMPSDRSAGDVAPGLKGKASVEGTPAEVLKGKEVGGDKARDLVELDGRTGRIDGETPQPVAKEEGPTPAFVVRGRVVHGDSGAPLAGCDVRLRRERGATDTDGPWQGLEPAGWMVTVLDGEFELQIPEGAERRRTVLRLARNGFVPRMAQWKRPAKGEVVEVGDIAMDRAIGVTGLVTYPDREPVPDAGILFANVALTGQTLVDPERMLRTRTDGAGRFELSDPAFFGEWYPRVEGSGALIEPQMVVLGEAEYPDYHIHITVEKPDPTFSIIGRCEDVAGQALGGVRISASGAGFLGLGWSREDGSFEIPRGGPSPVRGEVTLSASDEDQTYEQVLPEVGTEFAWGDEGVRCVLRRRPEQVVRVVDARGESVTEFSLFVFAGGRSPWTRQSRLSSHGTHPDGRVELKGLRSGKNAVLVVPKAEELGTSGLVQFESDGAMPSTELTVIVPDPVDLRLRLSDGAGAPVVGSRIEILTGIRGLKPKWDSPAVAIADCDAGRYTPTHARLALGTSDSAGTDLLKVAPGTWYLRITGDSHIPYVEKIELQQARTSVPITLLAGCSLTGSVGPEAALVTLAQLSPGGKNPVTVELKPKGSGASVLAQVQPDGSFGFKSLEPGEYDAILRYWMRTSDVTEGWIQVPMETLELSADQNQTLYIDAQPHLPGLISGRFQVDGQPLSGKHCFAKQKDPGPVHALRFSTDSEGRFEARIPPGNYTYAITMEAQPGPGWIMMTLPETWNLAPGDEQNSEHNLELRTIRVRLLDEYGAPITHQKIGLDANGFHNPTAKVTDATGWVTLDPAPLDAFHITATIHDTKQTLGPVDLPPGQTTGDVTLRIGEER
ncbi:MAG: hypothetical protein P1V35_06145 [Planctomycetota bacterium]|nr:hypothetical protein [Planctomycetota bacterium]